MSFLKRFIYCTLMLMAINIAAEQTLAIDLSLYDSVYVQVSIPKEEIDGLPGQFMSGQASKAELENLHLYLAGVLIKSLREGGQFKRVGEAREDEKNGVLVEINITKLKMPGLGRAFFGALAGRDRVEGIVRLVDLSNGDVLAEKQLSSKGSFAHAFASQGNLHAALENFTLSLLSWAELANQGSAKPQDWHGVLSREAHIAVRCSGLELYKQTHETLCDTLKENLAYAGVSVAESSSTLLNLHVETAGRPINSGFKLEVVAVNRWTITQDEEVIFDDILTTRSRSKAGRKRLIRNIEHLLRMNVQTGISLLWPGVEFPQVDIPR